MIPQSFISDLLSRADVVDVVGRHVDLKKGGINFKGLCPFHGEKSPSFMVSPTRQTYHCFGCGVHGNAIGFLMAHAGLSFVEAVADLAQQYGLTVPEDERSPQQRAEDQALKARQSTLTGVLSTAGEHYRKQLKNNPRAIAYLKGRGLSGEVARTFGIGYSPEGWHGLASVFPDYADPLLQEAGLVIHQGAEEGLPEDQQKRYDRFRDRIMFPIRNVKGEVIGFGGRVLDKGEPKYLNSPETPVFHKGRELYGLFECRNSLREMGYALVVEGYMDVVALAQLGFPNAVATLGTACGPEHVNKLFKFTDQIVFSFDGDAAGQRAALRALEAALPFATDTRQVKFLFLPTEHDPDSYVREFGADAFARVVGDATPLSRQLVDQAREGCDLNHAEGRALMLSRARPLWLALPDGALKRQLLGELAQLADLGGQELLELWQMQSQGHRQRPAQRAAEAGDAEQAFSPGRNYKSKFKSKNFQDLRESRPRGFAATRRPPGRRELHAVRMLLAQSAWWEELSHTEHHLLCDLPSPYGELFKWLEVQVHEHGPMPWSALESALQDQAFEGLAHQAMADWAQADEDQMQALRDLLQRMEIDALKAEENECIQRANVDPQALAHYREIQTRRKALELAAHSRPQDPAE